MNRVLLLCLFFSITLHANSQKLLRKISKGSDVTVIIFLAIDCPISQKYIPALNGIHAKYDSGGVKIHSVIPGKTKKAEIAKFRDEYRIAFNVSPDKRYKLVETLSAHTTPEVFIFDSQLRVRYRGAIDNWFYELGGYRKEATEHYVIDAIDALLAGKQPKIETTKALGCSIQLLGRK